MGEHELAAREAAAEAFDVREVALIGDACAAHDMQHQHAIGLIAQPPHPLRGKVLEADLSGVIKRRVEAVGFDADKVLAGK